MNVYRMSDYEWWIDESLEACISGYIDETGCDPCEDFEPFELGPESLDKFIFVDDDGTERKFKDQIDIEIKIGGDFPRIFAATEW